MLQSESLENISALPMSNFVEGVQKHGGEVPAGGEETVTDMFRYSVIRIHSIETPTNWFAPFQRAADTGSIGSGFAVKLADKSSPDPIFVTNAHVVRNAHTVKIQMPSLGQNYFEAESPIIYEDFDLALVRLKDPQPFKEFLKTQGEELKVLTIKEAPVTMGMEVAAVGFPLGSNSLKLSRGVIAGTEQVDSRLVFQSTAPISPGSSGGPLFGFPHLSANGPKDAIVIGANFAASSDSMAQNANYVVPEIHIRQLLHVFHKNSEQLQEPATTRLAPPAAVSPKVPGGNAGQPGQPGNPGQQPGQQPPGQQPVPGQPQTVSGPRQPADTGPGVPMPVAAHAPSAPVEVSSHETAAEQPPGDVGQTDVNEMQRSAGAPPKQAVTLPRQEQGAATAATAQATRTAPAVAPVAGGSTSEAPAKNSSQKTVHISLKWAPLGAVSVEANDVLYNISGGCSKGVYIAKIEKRSVLKTANPPVEEGSFIEAVAGVPLDSFGMGRMDGFLGDPVPYDGIMQLGEHVEDPVNLTICRRGKQTHHVASMVWNASAYQTGIKAVTEPHFHPEDVDFEYFNDVAVMQMTLNHVLELLKGGRPATLGRWLLPENIAEPRLIVSYVKSGTYASRVLAPGMVISSLNGHNVTTLRDFRTHFQPHGDIWRMETERGVVYTSNFQQALHKQLTMVQAGPEFSFLKTQAFIAAVQNGSAQQPGGAGGAGNKFQATNLNDLLRQAYMLGVNAGLRAKMVNKSAGASSFLQGTARDDTGSLRGGSAPANHAVM